MKTTRWPHVGMVLLAVLLLAACAPVKLPATGKEGAPGAPPMATPIPAPAPTLREAAPSDTGGAAQPVSERLVIKTATMTLVVADVMEAMGRIMDLAVSTGGFVVRTDAHHEGEKLIATVQVRVPAEAFEATVEALRKMAVKVDSEGITGQDVTEEYIDLDAQIRNLQATEAQLQKFLEKATNVDETLKVYRELTNVRSQIDRIKGRMDYLKKSSALSTITVTLRPQEKEKPIVQEEGFDPGRTLRDALRALVRALQGLVNLLIWLLVFALPVVVILLLPFLVLWVVWRAKRRRG